MQSDNRPRKLQICLDCRYVRTIWYNVSKKFESLNIDPTPEIIRAEVAIRLLKRMNSNKKEQWHHMKWLTELTLPQTRQPKSAAKL